MRCVSELSKGSGDVVSSAVMCGSAQSDDTLGLAGSKEEKDIPLLSYNCDEIQTQALFCAGNAKLDSRMSSTARRRGLAMATMA